jgi:hypothetical protein
MANLTSVKAEEPLIKLVVERLFDSSQEVQLAALHSVYNLAEANLTSLMNCGVLEMVEGLLTTHFTGSLVRAKQSAVYANSSEEALGRALACEALELLSHLCELSAPVHAAISASVLVNTCIELLSVSCFELPVCKVKPVSLLAVLTEDNTSLSHKLLDIWGVIQQTDTQTLRAQVAKAGVLFNIAAATQDYSRVFRDIIPVVLAAAVLDLTEEFERVVRPVLGRDDTLKHFEAWEASVRAVKQAFEILTNVFTEELVPYEFLEAPQTTQLLFALNKVATGLPEATVSVMSAELLPQAEYLSMQCAALTCLQNILLNTPGKG